MWNVLLLRPLFFSLDSLNSSLRFSWSLGRYMLFLFIYIYIFFTRSHALSYSSSLVYIHPGAFLLLLLFLLCCLFSKGSHFWKSAYIKFFCCFLLRFILMLDLNPEFVDWNSLLYNFLFCVNACLSSWQTLLSSSVIFIAWS